MLSDWFSRPHVEPWWREPYDVGSIERKYGPSVDGLGPTELFVIETEGDEARTGMGLGPQIIDAFVGSTWQRYPGASEIVVAVQQANRRSGRALEKAGFERTWSGNLESDDPSDAGPSFVYVRRST